MGNGERDAQALQRLLDGFLVRRVRKREQQGDGDGLGALCFNLVAQGSKFVRGWFLEDLAFTIDPLVDSETQFGGNQGFHAIEEEVVELGARLAADFDGVLETCSRDQRQPRSLALEDGVCAHGSAMQQNDGRVVGNLANGFGDGLRGIGRRGEDF